MNITYQPLTQAHKTDVFLLANDQAISRTSGVPLPPFSIQVIENWIVQTQPAIEQHHVILVDNNIVGMLILKKIESHHAELAFWIGQQFWGYGYAYAAARALIDQLFLSNTFDWLDAHVLEQNNPASRRTLEKLGFARTSQEPQKTTGRHWVDFPDDQWIFYRLEKNQASFSAPQTGNGSR